MKFIVTYLVEGGRVVQTLEADNIDAAYQEVESFMRQDKIDLTHKDTRRGFLKTGAIFGVEVEGQSESRLGLSLPRAQGQTG